MARAFVVVPIPRTASRNDHSRSGFSGLPKFRQFVSECGLEPTAARLRHTSSTADAPPANGSIDVMCGVEATAIARARHESTRGRITDASPWAALPITPCIGFSTVDARTSWSYCRITYSFEAMLGAARSLRIVER